MLIIIDMIQTNADEKKNLFVETNKKLSFAFLSLSNIVNNNNKKKQRCFIEDQGENVGVQEKEAN